MTRSNAEISAVLNQVADLLELKVDNPFKIRAYRRAADAILALETPVSDVLSGGGRTVPGIGDAISAKVMEIVNTGELQYLNRLREEVPEAIGLLVQVPGIGPKAAWKLHDTLGVHDSESLLKAAREKRIRDIPGFGAKSELNIIKSLESMDRKDGRVPLHTARPIALSILSYLSKSPLVRIIEVAGSIRRWKDTIGDIDIVASSDDPEQVMDLFATLPMLTRVTAKGPTRSSGTASMGIGVDLRVVKPDEYWTLVHHMTGSSAHHVKLRGIAGRKGLKISEYSVTVETTGHALTVRSEHDIYSHLDMAYVPPEAREDRGEIDAALARTLPDFIERRHIKGDLHTHSSWSDGTASIEEMARAARNMGYEYIAITDHSKSLGIARGLDHERLRAQIDEIRTLNESLDGITVLAGVECDILKDGQLDLDDEILASLDLVIASVHSGFRQEKEVMTERVLRALDNPHVDILAHPTGRIIGYRTGYEIDVDRIIEAAHRNGKALEINSYPDRLDLSDVNARTARDMGVLMSVDTDSHGVAELSNIDYGIATARRGWLEPRNVLNAKSLSELREWRRGRKH